MDDRGSTTPLPATTSCVVIGKHDRRVSITGSTILSSAHHVYFSSRIVFVREFRTAVPYAYAYDKMFSLVDIEHLMTYIPCVWLARPHTSWYPNVPLHTIYPALFILHYDIQPKPHRRSYTTSPEPLAGAWTTYCGPAGWCGECCSKQLA